MTDSVKIERRPHDPIASTLSAADDRIVMSEWLPPQEGIVPRIRIGRRWINTLWALPIGAAAFVFMRGNVVDLAVGIIIGVAFSAIVGSLVKDILNPIIRLAIGGVDFSNIFIPLNG
jgi:hypothetical protein